MWKWLRSWFAWRFSLARLVVATVFLGAVVGLNMREIGPVFLNNEPLCCWGWPFPFIQESGPLEGIPPDEFVKQGAFDIPDDIAETLFTRFKSSMSYRLPWTHRTYLLLGSRPAPGISAAYSISRSTFIFCAIIDALFALTVVGLILFLQIPRRKALSPPPARAGG